MNRATVTHALLCLVAWGCACSQEGASSVPASVSSSATDAATACVLGVEGTRASTQEVDGGIAVTLVGPQVDAIRLRARSAAIRHGAGAHEGPGHEGTHTERRRHGLQLFSVPPADAVVEDVDGGARITLTALVPAHADALREQVRDRTREANAAGCDPR